MSQQSKVFVIGPTRAVCLNITASLKVTGVETILMRERNSDLIKAGQEFKSGKPFGIMSSTGTGKTIALRPMIQKVLDKSELAVDLVTREHEASDYTWECDVVVVTSGVARNWLDARKITSNDFIIIDEIHQTSDDLELTMGLALHHNVPVSWSSATVEQNVYVDYLSTENMIVCDVFDAERKAKVITYPSYQVDETIDKVAADVVAEKRGCAVFVTTRAQAERFARETREKFPELRTDFYHGGESASKLDEYVKTGVKPPFMIFMTPAGQSSLNLHMQIEGKPAPIDTLIVIDQRYSEVVKSGVRVLVKDTLHNNDLLQMFGRVHGRAVGGVIHFITDRYNFKLDDIKPTIPEFQLGGDLERVALTCAKLGIDLTELDVIGEIDKDEYKKVFARFVSRGLINSEGRLTPYGAKVHKLPTNAAWGELLVKAQESKSQDLLLLVATVAATETLFKLVRNWREMNGIRDFQVSGSDHLTAYNVVSYAIRVFGRIYKGNGNGGYDYSLNGGFNGWARENNFSDRAIRDAAMGLRSILQKMNIRLTTDLPILEENEDLKNNFIDLLAEVQSLDTVHNSRNKDAGEVFGFQYGTASVYGTAVGVIRHWTDKRGHQRSSMEATQIAESLVNKYAKKKATGVNYFSWGKLHVTYQRTFGGQELGSSSEAQDIVAEELVPMAVEALAKAFLSGSVEHSSYQVNKAKLAELADLNNRWYGKFGEITNEQLVEFYASLLDDVYQVEEARKIDLTLTDSDISFMLGIDYATKRARVLAIRPNVWTINGNDFELDYTGSVSRFGGSSTYRVEIRLSRWVIVDLKEDQLPNWRNMQVRVQVEEPGYRNLYIDLPNGSLDDLRAKIEQSRKSIAWDAFKNQHNQGDHDVQVEVAYGENLPEYVGSRVWDWADYSRAYPALVNYSAFRQEEDQTDWYLRWYQTKEEALAAREKALEIKSQKDAEEKERRNWDELVAQVKAEAEVVENLMAEINWDNREVYGLSSDEASIWNGLRSQFESAKNVSEKTSRFSSSRFGSSNEMKPAIALEKLAELKVRVQKALANFAINDANRKAEEAKKEALEELRNQYGWPAAHVIVREDGEVAVNCGKANKLGRFDVTPSIAGRQDGPETIDDDGRLRSWQPIPTGKLITVKDYSSSGNLKSELTFTVPVKLGTGVWAVTREGTFYPVIYWSGNNKVVPSEVAVVEFDSEEEQTNDETETGLKIISSDVPTAMELAMINAGLAVHKPNS